MPALIAVADTIDLELVRGTTTLDRYFDIQQAKGGIGLQSFLVEIDKRNPAVFALAATCIRRHLRIAAATQNALAGARTEAIVSA